MKNHFIEMKSGAIVLASTVVAIRPGMDMPDLGHHLYVDFVVGGSSGILSDTFDSKETRDARLMELKTELFDKLAESEVTETPAQEEQR